MTLADLKKTTLPDSPGVYFFIGRSPHHSGTRKILYIGKATSLKDRVRSYFSPDLEMTRGRLLVNMLGEAKAVKFIKTDSVLEALILEANLIKKHLPRYNSVQKDDKSFNYVVFTDEAFPALRVMRGKDLSQLSASSAPNLKPKSLKLKAVYGPFPHGLQFKEAMKIIRRIFPYRDEKCLPADAGSPRHGGASPGQAKSSRARLPVTQSVIGGKPCFNRQIGLCPGVCTGEISEKEYAKLVRQLQLFFEGRKKQLLKQIERDMKAYAKEEKFEQAAQLRKRMFALQHIQDVSLIKSEFRKPGMTGAFRIESYDIAHLSGGNMVGVMTVVENGEVKKADYRKFRIRSVSRSDDTKALAEVLTRRLAHEEWPLPDLMVIDGGKAQKNIAEAILRERKFLIPVASVVKDERHRPREILGEKEFRTEHEKEILLANSEAHRFAIKYHRDTRRL